MQHNSYIIDTVIFYEFNIVYIYKQNTYFYVSKGIPKCCKTYIANLLPRVSLTDCTIIGTNKRVSLV